MEETLQESREQDMAQANEAQAAPDEKQQLIDKLTQERDGYLDLAQRARAEFDNYRRRNESAIREAVNDGVRDAVCALLPVLDNMDRAVAAVEAGGSLDALKEGVNMVFSQLRQVLRDLGLQEIEALGKPFDPNLHHAVMQGEATEDCPPDTVQEVMQKGYSVREKIVRHCMVKVAK